MKWKEKWHIHTTHSSVDGVGDGGGERNEKSNSLMTMCLLSM